jgi:hypothetical protein
MTTAHNITHSGSSNPNTADSPAFPSAIPPAPRIISLVPKPSAEDFISEIILNLGTLKTPESNRWAPIIKGDNLAGISLKNILRIAYELSYGLKDTEKFFKKGLGGKRNHSKIIFNLVKSLIDNPEINKEQLDILKICVTSLNTINFPPSPDSVRPTRIKYLHAPDYKPLIQQIEQRKILQPRTPNSPALISEDSSTFSGSVLLSGQMQLPHDVELSPLDSSSPTSQNRHTLFGNPHADSPAFPSATPPAPRIISLVPKPSAEDFISEIILNLGTLKTPESNRWAPIIKGDNLAGISLKNILRMAYELSWDVRETEKFFKKGVDGKRNHSKIIFNLVESLISNPEINKEQLDILETCVTSLKTIDFPQSPGSVRPTHIKYLHAQDYKPLIQQIEQRKILQPPTPNSTGNSTVSTQPDQVSQLQETDIQRGLKRKADSESIPPKRKRDTLEEMNMPPLQITTKPAALSASKNVIFKAPASEDAEIRATKQKRIDIMEDVRAAKIILTIQRDYHSLQWRW